MSLQRLRITSLPFHAETAVFTSAKLLKNPRTASTLDSASQLIYIVVAKQTLPAVLAFGVIFEQSGHQGEMLQHGLTCRRAISATGPVRDLGGQFLALLSGQTPSFRWQESWHLQIHLNIQMTRKSSSIKQNCFLR